MNITIESWEYFNRTLREYDENHFRKRYLNAVQRIANEWNKTAKKNRYFEVAFSEPNYKLKMMDSSYQDERVNYFTKQELEYHQVFAINGLLYRYYGLYIPDDNRKINLCTTSKELDKKNGEGEMIVMDRLGSMFIAPKRRGRKHHSSFFSGGPVAFAGLCKVRNGKIKHIRYSGHYTPGSIEEDSFKRQLKTKYIKHRSITLSLKIDIEGILVQTISISSKKYVSELYDAIAKIGGYIRECLVLKNEGDTNTSYSYALNPNRTMEDENLKSRCRITAFEYSDTRVYLTKIFELTIVDSEEDEKISSEKQHSFFKCAGKTKD